VRHRREERRVQPLGPNREALGVATGAEVPALAGKREQVFVRAGITADAGEAVLEHAAGEELVGHVANHRTPRAELAREALVVDRLQAMQMVCNSP